MKKIIAILTAASAVSLSVEAQGLVTFSSSTQKVSLNSAIGGPVTSVAAANAGTTATTYYYALFASANATTVGGTLSTPELGYVTTPTTQAYAFSDTANWTFVDYAVNTTIAGRFTGDEQTAQGVTTVPGIAGGATAQFVVVGWNAALGSTLSALETALATPGTTGWLGESAISPATGLGNGSSLSTPSLFGASAPALQGFGLGEFVIPTPEPSTIALGVMGACSLLALRRRKA
jgi:hypothetical protein